MTINTGTTFVKIASDSDATKTYTVEIENGQVWWCSCPQWNYRRPEGGCKHMQAAQHDLNAITDMMEGLR